MEYEPYQFTPCAEYFKVFVNNGEIIGCGNFVFNTIGDRTEIDIKFIEAYGKGKGRDIINYLLRKNKFVCIEGCSLKESVGFWEKVGAHFTDDFNFKLVN